MSGELISFPAKGFDRSFAKLWLGFFAIACLFILAAEGVFSFGAFVCLFMLAVGFYYFKQTVWGLADEVWDNGDFLLVVKSGQQYQLFFNQIKSIKHTYPNHKHLITISTKYNNSFGRSVTFRAEKGYPVLKSPKILNSLQGRVYNA
ncbi:hypothetical protein [Zhongshania arctica]|uniref:Uncharacterized protein n=1 Tax=Zhongshania arctica TaxID=3238302 RepID=A0ABV3TY05_9GAMM